MPPVTQQGSRNALITWSVVTGILFVTAAIFAIYFYVAADKSNLRYEKTRKDYADILPESDMQTQAISDLKEFRRSAPEGSGITANMSVFNVLLAQRDQLSKLIGGAAANDAAANDAARRALAGAVAAGQPAGITISAGDNLALAVTALANGLTARLAEIKSLQGELTQAKAQQQQQVQQFEAARAEMNKTLEQVRAEQTKAVTDVSTYNAKKDADVAEIEKSRAAERQAAQDAQNKAQVALAEAQRQITALNQQIQTLQNKFAGLRVDTQAPVVRQADGRIIRIPTKDTVYINLGSADSITPGLTFEVYDKLDGIPPAGDPSSDDALPKGKASIEVIRVGPGSSEARVTRQTPGTQLTEGDLIANLVYDRNVKYVFMVYGDFDLDRNGQATPADAEVIRRLITQWGGKLTDQVNVDTDFVVLGKEPVLPSFSKEDLQDPFNAKKLADAQAALDAYQAVRKTAADLHVPILNQNRFLYFIGYYDQAKR